MSAFSVIKICSDTYGIKKNYFNIKAQYNFKLTFSFLRFPLREAKETGTRKFFLHRVGMLSPHFGTYGLVTMFHCECLQVIDRVQNSKQVSRFCLDHSCARNRRNGRVIRKLLKQTCSTKQRKEKRLEHKVSGYTSQSKR